MQAEFETLFKIYHTPILTFLKKIVKSEEDAEDLAQEIFSNLWQKPEVWHNNPEIDRYIYRMAKYSALTFLRDLKHEASKGHNYAPLESLDKIESDRSTIDPILCNETLVLFMMGLDKMPLKRREVFKLSRFDGLSHNDIAKKMNLSVRTVESHIHSALSSLKKAMFIWPHASDYCNAPIDACVFSCRS